MWTNDMNVELIRKAPIQFMHKARLVVTMPPGISRSQYQDFLTIWRRIFKFRH